MATGKSDPARTSRSTGTNYPTQLSLPIAYSGAILPALKIYDKKGKLVEVLPAEPCPWIMTADEVVRFCRIDSERPDKVVERLREKGLRGVKIGQHVRFIRDEVIRFLKQLAIDDPR